MCVEKTEIQKTGLSFEILLATVGQKNDSILGKMRVDSDIIVCNQKMNFVKKEEYLRGEKKVTWFDFDEKGVGLNRNNALMRSNADICLLADDDVVFRENYEAIILQRFTENPKADVIIFNIGSPKSQPRHVISKCKRITRLNCGKFGAVRIAFRRRRIIKNTISFNLLFGGGAEFSAGEDTLFLIDCIRKGLNVIGVPDFILDLNEDSQSSWFKGYTDKFFQDIGISSVCQYGVLAFFASVALVIKRRKQYLSSYSFFKAVSEIRKGIKMIKEY